MMIALSGDLMYAAAQAHRRPAAPDIGHLPTTDNGHAVVLSVTDNPGMVNPTVTVQGPEHFAGVYAVDRAKLAEGMPHCLVLPGIDGNVPGATELHARSGLWIYDKAAFGRAATAFTVSRCWTHDGVAVPGETDAVYLRREGDGAVDIGLREQATALVVGPVTAEAVPVSAAVPDLPRLQISDTDSDMVVEGVDATATHAVLGIGAPSPYAGQYQVALADLAAGQPICLVPPVITVGPDRMLSARAALWVYDPEAYATDGTDFTVEYAWITEDDALVAGASDLIWTRSTYRAVRFRETASGVGGSVPVFSPELPAVPVPATTTTTPRPIALGSLLTDRRAISFATMATYTGLPATVGQRLLSRSDTATQGPRPLTAGSTAFRTQYISNNGVQPSLSSVSNLQDPARPKLLLISCGDLDKAGGAGTILTHFITNGAVTSDVSFATNAVDPADRIVAITSLLARDLGPTFAEPFLGTLHGFIWISAEPFTAVQLRDALFEQVPLDIDPTGYLPRILPDDGTVIIGGSPVTPLIYLRGSSFGQFDDGGTWKVPNHGSAGGTLTLLNGAF